jgi:lipopolysaccharide export system permease protein
MILKKLDSLLVTTFIPPFIVTFFIALFVFVMQTLWLYIDDIAGKGVGFFLMIELVGYMSISMIPLALPVAVLISSVMVLGNMAERYELSSVKSAGVSLWRVMRPLMVVTLGIGLFSFFCSNYFIPVSNLKFKSRLHDIKNQKPALSLEESVFNNDFQGFSIRLGDKLPDGQTIRDVIVYDNKESNQGRMTMVAADSGQMYGSEDGKYFVMHLFEGNQYTEPKPVTKDGKRSFPMMRASFEEWTKVFDLDEFEIDRTDENLFKSHHTMLSNRQLLIAIDSIDKEIGEKVFRLEESTNKNYYFWEKAYEDKLQEERRREAEERRAKLKLEKDSILKINESKTAPPEAHTYIPADTGKIMQSQRQKIEQIKRLKITPPPEDDPVEAADTSESPVGLPPSAIRKPQDPWPQTINGSLKDYTSILGTFQKNKQAELLDKAKGVVRTLRDQAENTEKSLRRTRENRVKHVYEFNSKFSLAIACFIFLFVGAPMGAIVRKGGFGWPLLISIVFFMLFIVIGIFSKNIAERFVIDAVLASWMNSLVVFPMGLVLTYWAMRDISLTQLMDFLKIKLPAPKKNT